jgi:hypothetical protein
VTAPSARTAIDRVLCDSRAELHTAFPARVLAYDAYTQTVDVRPGLMREVPTDDVTAPWSFEELPDLLAVQLMSLRTGRFAITFPVEVGDWVLVLCAEQSTMLWRSRGEAPAHPGLNDPHGLNGCVAIPGWFPDSKRLTNVSTTDLVIGSEDGATTLRIKPDGTVRLGAEDGDDFVALAAKVDAELKKIALAFSTFVAGSGGAAFPKAYTTAAPVGAKKVKAV